MQAVPWFSGQAGVGCEWPSIAWLSIAWLMEAKELSSALGTPGWTAGCWKCGGVGSMAVAVAVALPPGGLVSAGLPVLNAACEGTTLPVSASLPERCAFRVTFVPFSG